MSSTNSNTRLFAELESSNDDSSSGGDEEENEQQQQPTAAAAEVCPKCGIAKSEMTCDGTGRMIGGLGAIFEWIPVKAYRPCPNLVESGGIYSRTGQGLDEIAFGRDSTFKSD